MKRALAILGRIEAALPSVLLLLAGTTALAKIVARNFNLGSMAFSDPLQRTAVLWLACLGLSLGAGRGTLIGIDAGRLVVPPRFQRFVKGPADLFGGLVALVLCYAAIRFVQAEALDGRDAFLGLPGWIVPAIMPPCFLLAGIRLIVHGVCELTGRERCEARPKVDCA